MNIDLNLGLTQDIIKYCKGKGILRNQLAYILATGYIETAFTMTPIKETVMAHHKNKRPTDKQVIARLERWYKSKRPKVKTYWRDGYFGRGLVQITHDYNYRKLGDRLSVDFMNHPDLVMSPKYAIPVMVIGMVEGLFTGKKLDHYITLNNSDFKGARRIINGTDRASEIAEIAHTYDAALIVAGYDVTIPKSNWIADLIKKVFGK